jgi:hypothetical protein
MRHHTDAEEAWEYTDARGVHHWRVSHVVAATLAGALIWFAVVYLLTVIVDALW